MAKYRKLGRTASQRKALLRNQVTNLLYHGSIRTTETKAKEIKKIAEGLIALAVREADNFETETVKVKVPEKDANGKRVKEPHNRITWVHTALKIPDYTLRQCLFGEHLLRKYPDMFIVIVESEKTAIIASGVFDGCIVMACGGCQNLTIAMCEPLRGRNVVLIPDNGKLAEWSEKGRKLRHLFKTLQIATIMEQPDTLQRWSLNGGDDIGDLIIARNLDIANIDFGFEVIDD